MTFLIRAPHRIKKKQTKEAQGILDNLAKYLDESSEEPVEMLCGFWKDQQDAITYQELRVAVQDGALSEGTFKQWSNDYSVLVQKQLTPIWNNAIEVGSRSQPIVSDLEFAFNTQTPGLMRWISERGAEFVTASTVDQRKAIASLLAKKVTDEHTVDELARLIRPCIGLTDGDSKATLRYYDNIVKTLKEQHPRMKPESVRKKALDAATKYAEKKHRARAFTIAQTEMAFAYNRGADEGVRQAQQNNLLGVCEKRWITSGDDQVCPTCAALDGTQIGMDDNFDFKGRLLFTGQKLVPPAHPRCGCGVQYIEVDPPVFQENQNAGLLDIEEAENEEAVSFSDGEAAYEFFGKKPDRSLRRENREEYNRLMDEYKNNSQFGAWEQSLTASERLSIENYTGNDYAAINGMLRHEMTKNQVDMWNKTCNMPLSDMIDNIASGISKFDLKSDIVVYRTCENDVLENLQLKAGSIFHDGGFGSTSATTGKKASGNIVMEITVPKGKGVGAWVNPMNAYEGTDRDEYEFLLNRGTDYTVTGIEKNGENTVVKMKVVGRTETQWSYATKEEVIERWKARGIYDEESAKLL